MRFDRTHTLAEVREHWDDRVEAGTTTDDVVRVAGRVMLRAGRRASSCSSTLRDGAGELQLFVNKAELGDDAFARFVDELDLGDWVGVEGAVMKTKKGELSVNVKTFTLLAKSLRPLPEKWHGLTDTDTRFRQRYVDLIANDEARARVRDPLRRGRRDARVPRRARLHRGRDAGAAPDPRAARPRGRS